MNDRRVKVIPRMNAPERLKFAIRKLEDVQESEAAALSGATALSTVPFQLWSLQNMLEQIRRVLMNAQANWEDSQNADFNWEGSQNVDFNVRKCLRRLEEVGISIETHILKFLDGAVVKMEPPYALPDIFKNMNAKYVNFYALYRLKENIQYDKSLVQEINIEDLGEPSDRATTQPAWQSLQNVDDIWLPCLGIHRTCILRRLVDQSLQTRSVELVGTNMFAKTVLAEKIYQSTEVKTHFEASFWLFPQILNGTYSTYDESEWHPCYLFKPIDILRKMLLKLGDTNLLDADDEDYLVSRLRQSLSGKRFLVVVDNNWKELWTLINAAFPDGNDGSRVLLTTEMQEHTSDYKYELPFLNNQDSLKLQKELEKKDFPVIDDDRALLNQSYSELPSVLKTCIVYTAAVFPFHSVVLADLLIRLWIVEGIIPHEEGTTMENIAESYLEQLVQRGLLRISGAYYHNQANHPIRTIMLPTLLHFNINKTARRYMSSPSEIKELLPVAVIHSVDAFVECMHTEGYSFNFKIKNFHGFALHMRYQFNQISSFGEGPDLKRFHHPSLHSLFFFHYVAPVASPPFTFLRVLAVFSSHIRFPEEYTVCWLDELTNLRYLGFIVCLVEGGSLGKTLDRLVKLEILDLSESFVSGLSEFINNNEKVMVIGPVKEELPEIWSPIPDMFQ